MPVNNPGIVFMGTPDFAVASLEAIIRAGYQVKAVITAPDKPSGRGLKMHESPVKVSAVKHGIPVLQPLKLKDPDFLDELAQYRADLQVIVAFRMLPEEVWNMPPLGTFNLHASLLPQYRGAAPINWAIINGEKKTGVTTFFLNHEIDKGSVIHMQETEIGENESAGDVHDRLMIIGADLVVRTIHDIATGSVKPVEQHLLDSREPLKPAPKIFKDNCRIDWNRDVKTLHDFIRGLSPYPAAWSELTHDRDILSVKIFADTPEKKVHNLTPGTILSDARSYLSVAAADGLIHINDLQLQAKRRMKVEEFLRGFQGISDYRFL